VPLPTTACVEQSTTWKLPSRVEAVVVAVAPQGQVDAGVRVVSTMAATPLLRTERTSP